MNHSEGTGYDKSMPVDAVIQAFLENHRQGLQPDIDVYCQRYPDLANELRAVLPAALLLEVAKPRTEEFPSQPTKDSLSRLRLGDYRLVREAGRGGMGIVYEAIQESLGRRVAVKTLTNSIAFNPNQRERFHRETRAVAALHHTNIVPVFAVGEDQGVLYYVMPFINGTGLEKVIFELRYLRKNQASDGIESPSHWSHNSNVCDNLAWSIATQFSTVVERKFDTHSSHEHQTRESITCGSDRSCESRAYWHWVARIGQQVADALQYASLQGVLHRDIKPSNLLMDADGVVWVTDFGLAKLDESEDLTRTGELLGTLRYLAPERMRGVHDIRGDVYGLGLTLYELLTLRTPFDSSDKVDLARMIIESEPVRPRCIDSNIPRDLETIVLKAIAKEPSDRYQTALQMADDLRLFLEDRPIQARRAGTLERSWRWCRRNPTVSSLAGCLTLLMMTTIAVLFVSNTRIRRESREKVVALRTMNIARSEREKAYRELTASEQVAQRRLYATQVNLAGQALQRGEFTRAEDLVASAIPTEGGTDLRGFEWNYLRGVLHQGLKGVYQHPQFAVNCLSFSPTRSLLLVAGGNENAGFACVYDTQTGATVYEDLQITCVVNGCAFSPDGSKFVLGFGDANLQVTETNTGKLDHWQSTVILVKSLAWSPDGKQIVVGGEHGELCLWNVPGYDVVKFPQLHKAPIVRTFFSDDGSRLYSSADWGNEGKMSRVWDMTVSPPTLIREFPQRSLVDESSDGRLVLGVDSGRIHLIDAKSKDLIRTQMIGVGVVVSAQFSSDDKLLYSASRTDRTVSRLNLSTFDVLRTCTQNSTITALAIEPGGNLWAAGDVKGEVRVWETIGPAPEYRLDDATLSSVAFVDNHTLILGGSGASQSWTLGDPPQPWHRCTGLRAISTDGKTIVGLANSNSKPKGQVVEVWRDGMSTPLQINLDAPIYMNCIAVSRSGKMLAVRSESNPILIYDLSASPPKLLHSLPGQCHEVAFSPDERLLLGGEQYGSVCVFDIDTETRLPNLADFETWWAWSLGVAFHRDGKYVAVGNESGIIRVWDTHSRKLISTMSGQPGEINSIAFFPDDRRLASGGADGVRIWDYQVGQELLSLATNERTTTISINPSGDKLAAVTYDGSVHVWVGCKTH